MTEVKKSQKPRLNKDYTRVSASIIMRRTEKARLDRMSKKLGYKNYRDYCESAMIDLTMRIEDEYRAEFGDEEGAE